MAKKEVTNSLNFVYIDEFLRKKGLCKPKLEILIPDAHLYKTLLFQPCGTIEAGNYFVRNIKQDLAANKLKPFFDLAKRENIDLAITPEYSCPWSMIKELIRDNVLPENKKLWIIGCESIKPHELKSIIEENDQITWIYEEEKVNTITDEKFLDPICYFLKTEDLSKNSLQDIIFIQFKINPMGGTPFEIQNLLPGENIYIFRNEGKSINLATAICSDSLILNIEDIPDYAEKSYLLIHPQLNRDPKNTNFSNYRKECYRNDYPSKEFICLNWARNTNLAGNIMAFGGSALYTKSEKLDLSDPNINHNHKNGLYYTNWYSVRGNIYFFNYDEHIFLFENSKTSQIGVPPQNRMGPGPKMISIYSWIDENGWCKIQNATDNFDELCDRIGGDFSTLFNLEPIDKERLIALSTGSATIPEWYTPKKIESFYVNENETDKRITFLHDPTPIIKMEKEKYVTLFGTLNTSIITEGNNFPENIKDLANNCSILYKPSQENTDTYNYNLYPQNQGAPATVVYIGQNCEINARVILDNMMGLFNDNQSGKRVVVWFENTNRTLVSIFNHTKPGIAENVTIPSNSYRKGGQINEY